MTPLQLPPEVIQRRFVEMRAAIGARQIVKRDHPESLVSEHPITALLWESLVWLHSYWLLLGCYLHELNAKRADEVVQCLEVSAAQNGIQTVTDRLLELFHALTVDDPARIPNPTLRRLVATSRLSESLRRDGPRTDIPRKGGQP